MQGKIVLVRRGGCAFIKKAELIQNAGGAGMVLGGLAPYLVRMGVEPRWKGLSTAIPVAMVSKRAYGVLVAEAYAGEFLSRINMSYQHIILFSIISRLLISSSSYHHLISSLSDIISYHHPLIPSINT